MLGVGPYADIMRLVAQQREVPLFDRLAHHALLVRHGGVRSLCQRQGQCAGRNGSRLHRPGLGDADHRRRPTAGKRAHDPDTKSKKDSTVGNPHTSCRVRLSSTLGKLCRDLGLLATLPARGEGPQMVAATPAPAAPAAAAGASSSACPIAPEHARFDFPLPHAARVLARGKPIKIVALGSSSTYGRGRELVGCGLSEPACAGARPALPRT